MENTLILRRINFASIHIFKTATLKVVEALTFDLISFSLDKLHVSTAIIKGLLNGQK